MEFRSQEILDELKQWFTRLSVSFEGSKAIKHQDANIRAEYFFRDLLNEVYSWNLRNANATLSEDQDSFDLCDDVLKIAAQVTVTTAATKIRKTLRSFIGTYDYKRIVFAYPTMNAGASQANFEKIIGNFDFDSSRDRIDLAKILKVVADHRLATQENVLRLVRAQLEPLGQALHLGTDAILDALIDVIRYMTDNAPLDELDSAEQDPDYDKKAKRLADHVAYLEQQYSANAGLHLAVSQAREAIGYDQAKIAKIQAWLKGASISLLRRYANNAGAAFDELASDLLAAAHADGSDAEMTAVRFLLADEFQRCNVFPNP